MITEDKVTEIFYMADDFCKFFDAMVAKYTLKPTGKRKYHRDSTMSKAEVMLIMILFHDSGYHCFKHFYLEKRCRVSMYKGLLTHSLLCSKFVELTLNKALPYDVKKTQLDATSLSSGMYILSYLVNGQIIDSKKFYKK